MIESREKQADPGSGPSTPTGTAAAWIATGLGTGHFPVAPGTVAGVLIWENLWATPFGDAARADGGGLVASLYSDDRDFLDEAVQTMAPWHGRLWIGSEKTQGQALGPGAVLPGTIHGGPGRAGGGEELGALRGLQLYMQRTAVQGDRALLGKVLGDSSTPTS